MLTAHFLPCHMLKMPLAPAPDRWATRWRHLASIPASFIATSTRSSLHHTTTPSMSLSGQNYRPMQDAQHWLPEQDAELLGTYITSTHRDLRRGTPPRFGSSRTRPPWLAKEGRRPEQERPQATPVYQREEEYHPSMAIAGAWLPDFITCPMSSVTLPSHRACRPH